MTSDKILFHGLTFYGRHGCHPAEQALGQKFVVDLEVWTDLMRAARSDDLTHTVDYMHLYRSAKEIVEGKRYNLLEALAEDIAQTILREHAAVARVWVRVRKPQVALPDVLDYLGVEIVRER